MRNTMKRVLIGMNFAFLIIIAILVCGCQSTPDKAAVVYGGGLEEKIKGSPEPLAAYDAPLSWQETLDMKGSDIKVEINATISVPDVTAFPVYKVKKTTFDITRIKPLVDYFTKGRDVIKYKEPTKAELEQELLQAKKDNDEEWIAELEERIAAAPETVEDEVITDWNPDKSPSGSFLNEDGKYASIDISPDRFGYMKTAFILSEKWFSESDKYKIEDIAISKEDAIAAAEDMLHELDIGHMAVGRLEKALSYKSLEDAYAQPAEEPLSKGYFVNFARDIDGITGITNEGLIYNISDDFAYKAPLYPEEIRVYVNEAGKVQSFDWSYPLTIEEKVNENVALLPFEDVKQRIRDMFIYFNSYDKLPMKVTSIEMNMAIVDVKEHPEEAMYVPAWFIYYTETYEDGTQQEVRFALNAVDGGRVLECPVEIDPGTQQMIDKDLQKR
ncbi:MAG: DUF6034 family protein [Burkholderiales bacterium]